MRFLQRQNNCKYLDFGHNTGKEIKNERFVEIHNLLKKEFTKSESFRNELKNIIIEYIKSKGSLIFQNNHYEYKYKSPSGIIIKNIISLENINELSDYLIQEIITLIDGIKIKNTEYTTLYYPTFKQTFGKMSKLAYKLFKKYKNKYRLNGNRLIEINI